MLRLAGCALTLALLLPSVAAGYSVHIGPGPFSGGTFDFSINSSVVKPGIVTICTVGYAPFMFWKAPSNCTNPCPASTLRHSLPTRNNPAGFARGYTSTPPLGLSACPPGGCPPNWISSDETNLLGFDREVVDLIFNKMLRLPYMFTSFGTFPEMRLGLLQGFCDVAISASNIDVNKALCASTPNVSATAETYDYRYGDYAAGLPPFVSTANSTAANQQVHCLNYGAPYLTTGFALMSLPQTKPFDISSAVFNTDILNAFSVITIITMASGYAAHLLERRSLHLGTVSRGTYWSIMTFFMASENNPMKKAGRLLMIVVMLANLMAVNVIGAILGAKLTTTALSISTINTLADVTGTLCQEAPYGVLDRYVQRQVKKPSKIVLLGIEACVAGVADGTFEAAITDLSTLTWYAKHMGLPGVYVSSVLQQNPFGFVYTKLGDALHRYVDPAVTGAVITDPEWLPEMEKLNSKWFASPTTVGDIGENPVNWKTLIAAIVLFGFPIFCSIFNGDIGPGIFKGAPPSSYRGRIRKFIETPSVAEDAKFMDEREGAMQGHDLSFFRFVVKQFEDLLARVGYLSGDHAEFTIEGAKPIDAADAAPAHASNVDLCNTPLFTAMKTAMKTELTAMLAPLVQDVQDLKAQTNKKR